MSSTAKSTHTCTFCLCRYEGAYACPHCGGSRVSSLAEKWQWLYFLLVWAGFAWLDNHTDIPYEEYLLQQAEMILAELQPLIHSFL